MLTCPLEVVRCKEELPPMRHTEINSFREAVRKFILVLEFIFENWWQQRKLCVLLSGKYPHRPE